MNMGFGQLSENMYSFILFYAYIKLICDQTSSLTNVKARPNERNMSTQHIATLLGATCCMRLATVLRCVATCWVLLAQI